MEDVRCDRFVHFCAMPVPDRTPPGPDRRHRRRQPAGRRRLSGLIRAARRLTPAIPALGEVSCANACLNSNTGSAANSSSLTAGYRRVVARVNTATTNVWALSIRSLKLKNRVGSRGCVPHAVKAVRYPIYACPRVERGCRARPGECCVDAVCPVLPLRLPPRGRSRRYRVCRYFARARAVRRACDQPRYRVPGNLLRAVPAPAGFSRANR